MVRGLACRRYQARIESSLIGRPRAFTTPGGTRANDHLAPYLHTEEVAGESLLHEVSTNRQRASTSRTTTDGLGGAQAIAHQWRQSTAAAGREGTFRPGPAGHWLSPRERAKLGWTRPSRNQSLITLRSNAVEASPSSLSCSFIVMSLLIPARLLRYLRLS